MIINLDEGFTAFEAQQNKTTRRERKSYAGARTISHMHIQTLLQLMVAIDYNEGIERSVRKNTGGWGMGAKNSAAYLQPCKV